MDHDRINYYFQIIQQQLAEDAPVRCNAHLETLTALEELQIIYEEIGTSLEVVRTLEIELLERESKEKERDGHYYRLFRDGPIAYLITDRRGTILEANRASGRLLNVPEPYLVGKPLILYIATGERAKFYGNLRKVSDTEEANLWRTSIRPRERKPVTVELSAVRMAENGDKTDRLQIGIYKVDRPLDTATTLAATLRLPRRLDGLRVLVVDDEDDARYFISTVLKSGGIEVRAVGNVGEALETIETFAPDILLCDIRMPEADGYGLIREIRQRESERGGHIRAAALTSYLDENRDKAIKAGFEAHLHKLARPEELIEMVARLAGQGDDRDGERS